MITVHAIQCLKCLDTIYSRATHDFHRCSCGACFIDGGFEYIRCGGDPQYVKSVKLNLKVTKKTLYDDWNYNKNKYGLIKNKDK